MASDATKMSWEELLGKLPKDTALKMIEEMYPEEAALFYEVAMGNKGGEVIIADKNESPKVDNPFSK
jgi:hypothetical protein